MESHIQLTDLPEDPMRHILEMCDFVTLQRLRKTCHTFRNFIDETKPVQRMNEFHVSGLPESLSLKIVGNNNYDLYPNGGKIELGYKDLGDGNTKITWQRTDGNREKIIKNNNNLDIFSGDFGTVFGCTQPKWNKISLGGDVAVLETFQGKLSSLKSPLKVHSLSISSIESQNLVVEIMKSFCPDTLNHLHFLTPYENWNMSEMVTLEQWKKAKELSMPFVRASADIESFFHFDSAIICFENVSMGDLCKLKKIMKSFCSDTLAHLHFDTPSETWNMSEMVKLEQWKKATELNMRLVVASPTDIESYSHFQYAIIFFENITMDDLCKIKKLFLNTPSITKRFELYGLNSLNKNLLVTKLGEPYLSGNSASHFWYFKRLDNYVLCMKYTENSPCFDFSIVTKAEVPREALIL